MAVAHTVAVAHTPVNTDASLHPNLPRYVCVWHIFPNAPVPSVQVNADGQEDQLLHKYGQ